jgi:isocitrate/isopropylmalate dehydrogenase
LRVVVLPDGGIGGEVTDARLTVLAAMMLARLGRRHGVAPAETPLASSRPRSTPCSAA